MRGGAVAAVGLRRLYGLVKYKRVVAVVGLSFRRIGLLMDRNVVYTVRR